MKLPDNIQQKVAEIKQTYSEAEAQTRILTDFSNSKRTFNRARNEIKRLESKLAFLAIQLANALTDAQATTTTLPAGTLQVGETITITVNGSFKQEE